MNAFKFSAVALALAASFSASAMTSIADADLSQVSGQDGVSIIADLNINIGSFTYTDNNGTVAAPDNASVSFKNIDINGILVATIDVLTNANFRTGVEAAFETQAGVPPGALPQTTKDALYASLQANTGQVAGSDVVQFAFPYVGSTAGSALTLLARQASPTIKVGSITTGNGGASFGSISINKLDLQGTRVWIFGH